MRAGMTPVRTGLHRIRTGNRRLKGDRGLRTKLLTRIALLSALAFVMMRLETQLPFLPPFLKYDPSEVPVLVGALALGPVAGVVIALVKNLLSLLLLGLAPVGIVANFVAGAVLAWVAGSTYRAGASAARLWLALLAGAVVMTLVMIPANYYVFLPAHGITGPDAMSMILKGLIPFNFCKAAISSAAAGLIQWRMAAYAAQSAGPALPHER